MNEGMKMLNIMIMKNKMSDVEKDALLSELICCDISKRPSELMNFLINDDFLSFQALVKFMTVMGTEIKENISVKK